MIRFKWLLLVCFSCSVTLLVNGNPKGKLSEQIPQGNQWQGKSVAFLGDSMTQKRGEITSFWEYLQTMLGIEPFVYGVSGKQWNAIDDQAVKLLAEQPRVDAIVIFAGTNDYNNNTPLGSFFEEGLRKVNADGVFVERKYRTVVMNDSTFCGRINRAMSFLKENFPDQQIILMTPIHRGFAKFKETNVQPDECHANALGLYLDDYVLKLKEASNYWAVPLIDLHAECGLFPLSNSHAAYFSHVDTDRLHLSSLGNERLACVICYKLLSMPSGFHRE
ncbi:MAG: SGNH/GDSL hydrolase family protein [Mangrovibacterium sp.]